jgi:hypothetical protein
MHQRPITEEIVIRKIQITQRTYAQRCDHNIKWIHISFKYIFL